MPLAFGSCDGGCDEFWESDEIVGGDSECEDGFCLFPASYFHPGMACLRLDPAEHFLDALAADLADAVAGMTSGARIDSGPAHNAAFADRPIDCNVRRHVARLEIADKSGRVIGLVGAERDAFAAGAPVDNGKRRLALRFSVGCWMWSAAQHRFHML